MLARREAPAPYPGFGYVRELDGTQFGVILLIFSTQYEGGNVHVQYTISSRYVDQRYRAHASFSSPRLFTARRIVPTLQLAYRRAGQDFARFAGPIGRTLMRCGSLFSRRRDRTVTAVRGQVYSESWMEIFRGT